MSPTEGTLPGRDVLPLHVPARMLNELAFCPRLFALEWRDGLWRDNAHTVEGRERHRNVDQPAAPRSGTAVIPGLDGEARALFLASDELGILAKLDRVIVRGSQAIPVEHKKGSAPRMPVLPPQDLVAVESGEPAQEDGAGEVAGGLPGVRAWWPDQVQVAAQAMLLEEAGFSVPTGVVYYAEEKRRVDVPVDGVLRDAVRALVARAREVAAQSVLPPPLVGSRKCLGCSLQPICLPDETLAAAESPRERAEEDEVRRILTSRDDDVPVYVLEQGARVGRSGETLRIEKQGEVLQQVPLRQVRQLCLFGNVQVTTQAVVALAEQGVPVVYLGRGGRFEAMTSGMPLFNVLLRKAQFEQLGKRDVALAVARGIVEAKVLNQRVLLMRNGEDVPAEVLEGMRREAYAALRADSLEEVRGHEGAAAALYFGSFARMLRAAVEGGAGFDFNQRNRRPARDPVNAMLSFGYALLAKELTATCLAVGLDPLLGALHAPAFKRPALALDLMEEWRALLVDSTVLTLVNNRMVGRQDFYVVGTACEMRDGARRTFLQAWENRLQTLVTHPTFGYRIAYRRALEVQVRLFARVLTGELPEYRGFKTR